MTVQRDTTMIPESDIAIRITDLNKDFLLSEAGKGPTGLWDALKAGEPKMSVRRIKALRDISLSVPSGQRLGIIGHNGAGKTTLLSVLAGVAEANSGTVEIDGKVHALLTIGAVLREEASGRENIRLDGAVHGKTAGEVALYEEKVIEFSELGEFIDRPVRTYSSGMKARLAFSMGAFVQPDVLIIDETLSVGDAFFSAKATKRMKEIATSGRVVILVSHSLSSIVEMCDRCLWMDHGRIVMDGSPEEVTRAYEEAIRSADEADLARKFGTDQVKDHHRGKGTLTSVQITQGGVAVSGNARAMVPITVQITGKIHAAEQPDLTLMITRVDGREIYHQSCQDEGITLPERGEFKLDICFDPMILGADLYRFEARLTEAGEVLDSTSAVCEMIDEEGQFGGVPLLLDPPSILVKEIGEDQT